MRDYNIILEPFQTLDVLSCDVHKTVNDHASLRFSGHIRPEDEERYLRAGLENTQVRLTLLSETGGSYTLLLGVVTDLRIDTEGKLLTLTLEAKSSSVLMDTALRTRVFQNAALSYDAVLRYNEGSYADGGHSMLEGAGAAIGDLLVQYHETDWAFAKRLASHFNTCVVPAYRTPGVKYYFGILDGRRDVTLPLDACAVKTDPDAYSRQAKNGAADGIDMDAVLIDVESREIYEIGDCLMANGQPWCICDIESRLVGRELVHRYRLKSRAGLRVAQSYNEGMIGASLEARITGVTRDTVQVQIAADGIQDNAKRFPYSTVYSSPDGTGWYCMPEVGDSVRLYMPTEKEKHGYIISAVHMDGGGTARSDPDSKSLKSKYDKEVLFTPGELVFTNNKGMMVSIRDDEGISIISDKAVKIRSTDSLLIMSTEEKVNVVAAEEIDLVQDMCSMTLRENIQIQGAQVHME